MKWLAFRTAVSLRVCPAIGIVQCLVTIQKGLALRKVFIISKGTCKLQSVQQMYEICPKTISWTFLLLKVKVSCRGVNANVFSSNLASGLLYGRISIERRNRYRCTSHCPGSKISRFQLTIILQIQEKKWQNWRAWLSCAWLYSGTKQ